MTTIGASKGIYDKYQYTTRIENDANGNPIYIGETFPGEGNKTNEAVWRIKKIDYDNNGNPIYISFAEGNDEMNKIWDDRISYDYR